MAKRAIPRYSYRKIQLEEGVRLVKPKTQHVADMRVLLLLWRQRPTWLTAVEITTMLSSTKLHVHRALKRFKELNYVDRRPATPEERADRSHFDHFHLHMYRLAEEFVPD